MTIFILFLLLKIFFVLLFVIIPTGSTDELQNKPTTVYTLIVVNIVIHAFLLISGAASWAINTFGYIPQSHNYYALLTYQFIHYGIFIHVISNMIGLFIFGSSIEDRIGVKLFLTLYLGGGIFAAIFHQIMAPHAQHVAVIGASGSIYALMGFYLIMFPKKDIRFYYPLFFFTFHVSVLFVLPFYFILNLFLADLSNYYQSSGGVGHWVHVGGFLFGIPWGIYFKRHEMKSKPKYLAEKKTQPTPTVVPSPGNKERDILVSKVLECMIDKKIPEALQVYGELQVKAPGLQLQPADQLSLAQKVLREEKVWESIEIYKVLANNNDVDPILRARAAYDIAHIYRDVIRDREKAMKTYELILKKFPGGPLGSSVEQEHEELKWQRD